MKNFDYVKTKTLEEVIASLDEKGKRAYLVGEGTDVLAKLRQKFNE